MDYTPPIGTAPGTSYVDANPGSGIEGSRVAAAAIEAGMREIVAAIVASGQTPNVGNLAQLAAAIAGATNFPAGAVTQFAGPTEPAGWLFCNGQQVSRTTFAMLFAAIGTNYGVGDGATTFNLPDLRGRAVIGVGVGAGLTNRALGAAGGEEAHVLTTAEMPSHTHPIAEAATAVGGGGALTLSGASSFNTGATGGENAHNNMPPFLALNMIIKT